MIPLLPAVQVSPDPPDLSLEAYEALEKEWGTVEERYEEAVTRHNEWKAMKNREAKEAQAEKLRKEKRGMTPSRWRP